MKELRNGNEVSVDEETIDILRYLHILYIHKWLFIFILSLCLILAFLYTRRQKTFYRATYELFYKESDKAIAKTGSDVPFIGSDFDQTYWLSLMNSRETARLTLENSRLPMSIDALRRMISSDVRSSGRGASAGHPVFLITITSVTPGQIPVIFIAFVDALNELLNRHQLELSKGLIGFLENQMIDSYERLNQIDRQILFSQSENPFLVRDIQQLVGDLEGFRTSLQNSRIDMASIKAAKARTEMELSELDPTITNELAYSEPLKVQLMNLQVDLARALTRHREDHPRVMAIRNNINQINLMLRDTLEQEVEVRSLSPNPLVTQLMSKLLDFHIQEISLAARIESLQSVIAELEAKLKPDTNQVGQQQLISNRQMVLSNIERLNSRLLDVESAAQGGLARFLIIDEPTAPGSPANRPKSFFLLVGLMMGIALGFGGVILYDLIDNRIMLPEDFERLYNLKVLGSFHHNLRRIKSAFLQSEKKSKEKTKYYYQQASADLLFEFRRHLSQFPDEKVIAICSSMRKDGKTMVSLNLAWGLANRNMKVLLVDVDVLFPQLTRLFSLQEKPGLTEFINETISHDQIILPSNIHQKLDIVPAGQVSSDYSDEKFIPGLETFLGLTINYYDIIIIDTPALLFLPELTIFFEQINLVVPVVRIRHTTRITFDKLMHMLKSTRTVIPGVVLNDIRQIPFLPEDKYGYGYYGYYDYGYQKKKSPISKKE